MGLRTILLVVSLWGVGIPSALAAPCPFGAAIVSINARGGDPAVIAKIGGPTTGILVVPGNDGCYRHHQWGSLYWSGPTGTHFVMGAIRGKWAALGWERSFLRYPVTDELPTPDTVGRFNHFQGGSIYWHPSTGAFEVHGDIRALWANLGWERSFLGYPLTDETRTPDGIGRFNHFQGGSIYWKPNLGPHFILGDIRAYWANRGWERNPNLGYPITNELATRAGSANRYSDFENGVVFWRQQNRFTAELSPFPLASRTRADLEADARAKVAAMLAPHASKVYLDQAPHITEVTNYSRSGFNTVANRQVKISMRLKYRASFLGIDSLLPDPSTTLHLWLAFNKQRTSVGTNITLTLVRAQYSTHVPFPTSTFISAASINQKLRTQVLSQILGRTQVLGTLPPVFNVLSVKVLPNGDLRTYIEPL